MFLPNRLNRSKGVAGENPTRINLAAGRINANQRQEIWRGDSVVAVWQPGNGVGGDSLNNR